MGEAYLAWATPLLDALEACNSSAEMLAVLDSVMPDTEALAEYFRKGAMASIDADEVSAAANDPAERVRIATLAARARWRGHVKQLKKKLQSQYGTYSNAEKHEAFLSSQFVDKAYSGDARKKSFLNAVPDLVHLHAASGIVKLWSRAKQKGIQDSIKSKEAGKVKYGRYEAFFTKDKTKYRAWITTRIVLAENKEILYSIELFKA